MENETTPRYFTQVPSYINGLGLNSTDKLVFGCIYTMLNVTGKCFMSNARIGANVEVSPTTVNRSLGKLESLKLINRETTYKPNKEVDKRFITMGTFNPLIKNEHTPYSNMSTPLLKNGQDNISLNKSTNTSSSKNEQGSKVSKDTDTQLATNEQEVIHYLNHTINSDDFKRSKDLRARLTQGYTVKQLKQVIYYCAITQHWLDKQEMFMYLRPSTLFKKSNFEKYYSEAKRMLKHRAKSSGASKTPKHVSDEELYS